MKISVDFNLSGDLLLLCAVVLVTKYVSPQLTIALDGNPVDHITLETSVMYSTTQLLKDIPSGNHVLTIESDIECVYVIEKIAIRGIKS